MLVARQIERFLEDGIEFLFADVIPQDYDVTARDGGTSLSGKNWSTVSCAVLHHQAEQGQEQKQATLHFCLLPSTN